MRYLMLILTLIPLLMFRGCGDKDVQIAKRIRLNGPQEIKYGQSATYSIFVPVLKAPKNPVTRQAELRASAPLLPNFLLDSTDVTISEENELPAGSLIIDFTVTCSAAPSSLRGRLGDTGHGASVCLPAPPCQPGCTPACTNSPCGYPGGPACTPAGCGGFNQCLPGCGIAPPCVNDPVNLAGTFMGKTTENSIRVLCVP
jgi:hypothetical protein